MSVEELDVWPRIHQNTHLQQIIQVTLVYITPPIFLRNKMEKWKNLSVDMNWDSKSFIWFPATDKEATNKIYFFFWSFLKQRIKFRESWSLDSGPAAVIKWSKSRPKAWRYSGSSPDLQSLTSDPFWKPTAAPTAPSVCREEQRGRRNMFKDLCTTGVSSFKSLPLLSAFLWKCLDKGMKIK